MKKKMLSILLISVLILTSCSKENNSKNNKNDNTKIDTSNIINNPTTTNNNTKKTIDINNFSNATASIEDLITLEFEANRTASIDMYLLVYPEFVRPTIKGYLTEDSFSSDVYGKMVDYEFTVTGKTKWTQDILDEANDFIKEAYGTDDKLEECYYIDGDYKIKGTITDYNDSFDVCNYCRVNNKWYIFTY